MTGDWAVLAGLSIEEGNGIVARRASEEGRGDAQNCLDSSSNSAHSRCREKVRAGVPGNVAACDGVQMACRWRADGMQMAWPPFIACLPCMFRPACRCRPACGAAMRAAPLLAHKGRR